MIKWHKRPAKCKRNLGNLLAILKEETKMKKILSLLLCAILVCSMAVAASAEYPDKDILAINP